MEIGEKRTAAINDAMKNSWRFSGHGFLHPLSTAVNCRIKLPHQMGKVVR
jgi:hypothetical protein